MDIDEKIEAYTKAHATPVEKLGNSRVRAYVRISSDALGQDQRRQLVAYEEFCKSGPELTDKLTYLEINTAKGGNNEKLF